MKQDIEIKTADGTAKAGIFRPENGTSAEHGVILYMDAMGPRAALDGMAQRLADAGYIVLLPDLFYRFGAYGPFDGGAFGNPASRETIMTMLRGTTQEMTKVDSAAFLDALSAAGAKGAAGVVGYCMGGGRALTAAASYPDRIAAAASFHGGNLASDAEDSPHRLAANIKARAYIGVAGVDNSFPPEQSARLAEALRTGGVDHTIENYVGMAHGWTVPDHGVYDETGAERHWKRLLNLFEEALV
ncbi:dienelactone hydrolase [Rhizobium dioscoreae]|uniref:Dienelactone hydrolase n=1 Tax=Rhizobium dioscoreae TaxID=2653122 RepID=A0ABQ0YWH8_9HYPH|nr:MULTISPECIES: dienelactone hydrolase family protein [Rhizobium]TWB09089.1 carboxymethylenebutenolidase [Rhizobium sp. ERR1071]GES43999.1 dienelactone hydrolase [Rhizobium dioscoreae]GES47394.1 dienelactone hydrolase [Rhizobium dioscoreae]GLU80142.1 dienelactone hydrolase [Rhizobium sp. NBRC 114257]